MDLNSAVVVNVNVFFFFEVTMFFSVVRVIARAGASARTEIGHFPQIRFFFFLHSAVQKQKWGILSTFFFHDIFPMSIQKYSLLIFILPCQYFQSNDCTKRNSKFEREDKSNGNSLLHHVFFLLLSEEFSYEHSEPFLTIFFNAVLVFLEL